MPWLRAAAAVALLLGGGAALRGSGLFTADSVAEPPHEVATAAGQRARITLSDGT